MRSSLDRRQEYYVWSADIAGCLITMKTPLIASNVGTSYFKERQALCQKEVPEGHQIEDCRDRSPLEGDNHKVRRHPCNSAHITSHRLRMQH
mmetsp:Transcript_39984/g.64112  ORF Transcript_39984/g.64112 Transcript_39984/m.64112 type:complete len:92 (-) Transcript_39984:135-410(-)